MRKSNLLFMALAVCSFAVAQQLTHEATVVNIEVPVRVFDGGKFVDHLTINDFEVFENGKLQEIVALYLIKKTTPEKKMEKAKETKETILPNLSRNFILIFNVTDYLKKIDDALDYFFNNVLLPGDTVKAVTPLKTYSLNKAALTGAPKQEIKNRLKGILRKDIILAGADYRSFCQQIETIADDEGLDPQVKAAMCEELLRKMKDLSCVEESNLLEISDRLKRTEGQKTIFLFYQKEALPIPSFLRNDGPGGILMELRSGRFLDVEPIKRAFSDASITIHFIFLTNKPSSEDTIKRLAIPDITMQDTSAAIFKAFTVLAKTTGGLTESSANAASAFKRAVDASENYYLLYYHPSAYKKDGKFKEIKVKVKSGNYTITHRAGYVAE
jgi:VWFA-related protein